MSETRIAGLYWVKEDTDSACQVYVIRIAVTDHIVCTIDTDVPGAEAFVNLFTEAPNLLEALKLITPKECPIVTHHRPDCDFCLCLKTIAEAEGRELPEPRKNSPYCVTDSRGNKLRHG
jgi:hypothetical protein